MYVEGSTPVCMPIHQYVLLRVATSTGLSTSSYDAHDRTIYRARSKELINHNDGMHVNNSSHCTWSSRVRKQHKWRWKQQPWFWARSQGQQLLTNVWPSQSMSWRENQTTFLGWTVEAVHLRSWEKSATDLRCQQKRSPAYLSYSTSTKRKCCLRSPMAIIGLLRFRPRSTHHPLVKSDFMTLFPYLWNLGSDLSDNALIFLMI